MIHGNIPHLRLGCAIPNPEDGTSYHRALGPLSRMARQDGRLELWYPQPSRIGRGFNLGWDWVCSCHAVFLQRPYLPVHVQFAKQCKAMGLPLWIEWDDLLWDIPRSNPSHAGYVDKEEIKENIYRLVLLADVITTATVPLARALGEKAIVIPNAAHTKFYSEPRTRRVAWRGSASHEGDVATVLHELHELSRLPQFSKWKWHFSGGTPWGAFEAIPSEHFEESPGTGPVFFVPLLGLLAPWCLFVPLANSFFNQCKSNLAWIEATCAGCVTLGPDWEEWRRPGIINFDSPKDFKEKLRATMGEFKEGEFHPNVEISRMFIEKHLALDVVNKQRWQILNDLVLKYANA